jgi:hypothetical protein
MTEHAGRSGVRIAADFRQNLIIDRWDPVFTSMRASTRRHLHGIGAEDAVAWNVFRSLRQIAPSVWLPDLFGTAFRGHTLSHTEHATVELWKTVEPPLALLLDVDEGEAEVDVVIQTPSVVWFIEARAGSEAGTRTTTRAAREQVLRSIDVGSYWAGTRKFYFSLLVADARRSNEAVTAVQAFADLAKPRDLLAAHRPDKLANLGGVSLLSWAQLSEVLSDAAEDATNDDERVYAARALAWMRTRGMALE